MKLRDSEAQRLFRDPNSSVYGPARGYGPTVIDSAIAALALAQGGRSVVDLRAWLLGQQRADGGWPLTPGGPSRIEPTALSLQLLSKLGNSDAAAIQAVTRGVAFLRTRKAADGSFKDDVASASATAHAVLSLAEWHLLTPSEASGASTFLLAQQRPDGSWAGSAYQTAEALKALRAALSINVSIAAADVSLSSSVVSEGEPVVAQALIRNTGLATVTGVVVQAFDSNGASLSAPQTIASIDPGSALTATLRLDTSSRASSTQVFIVVDPLGTLEESREDDNRAALTLIIKSAPLLPDLFVAQGSVASIPSQLRGPTSLAVTATVGNSGQTAANGVLVNLLANGTVLSSTTVSIPAQGTALVSFAAPVASGPVALQVVVDPFDAVTEDSETNNQASLTVPIVSVVDLRVAAVTVTPASLRQGADAVVGWSIENVGTLEASGALSIDILDGAGAVLATIPGANSPVPVGATVSATSTWRANTAGALTARVRVTAPGDVASGNDVASSSFVVTPSPLSNLVVRASDLRPSPDPLLEAQPGSISVTVTNTGGAATAFDVEIYLGDPDAGGVLLSRHAVAGVASQGQVNLTATLPTLTSAALSIVAVVDAAGAVEEFDEDDNRAVATFTPASIPDLAVSDADVRPQNAFPRAGDSVPVVVSVLNQGSQDAVNAVVELFLGSATGTPIGTVTLPLVSARGRADASFVFATTGLAGAQTLVGVVNRLRSVAESRFDNNSGRRTLVIQDGLLALSNPYFSPNGDGVKDVSELMTRIPATESLEVEVADPGARVIRTLAAGATVGSVTWDGRDSSGLPVEDGPYRLSAWSVSGATRSFVGAVTAVVDTNHLLVTKTVGTPYFQTQPSLSGSPTPDDEAVVSAAWVPDIFGNNQRGIYLRPIGGGEIRKLSPDSWSQSEVGSDPVTSPDGRHFANLVFISSSNALRLHDFVAHTSRILVPNVSGNPVFSPDGSGILYFEVDQISFERRLEIVDVSTAVRRVVAVLPETPADYRFAPDGTLISYTVSDGLYVVPATGGTPRRILAGVATGNVDPQFGPSPGAAAYAWRASSKEIVYSSPGVPTRFQGPPCHAILYGNDDEYDLSPPECFVAQQAGLRTFELATSVDQPLFTDPGAAFLQFGSRSSVIASPFGRSIAFPHTPTALAFGLYFGEGTARDIRFLDESSSAPTNVGLPQRSQGSSGSQVNAWSPQGTFILTSEGVAASDANLRARVSASRPPGGGRLTFGGNATDWNFQDYELSVRTLNVAGSGTVVSRSNREVRDARFLDWTPPAPGRYELALKVSDLAGNSRTVTAQAGWSTSPAISSLSIAPLLFSPNGDGEKDTSVVSYFANAPVTADFEVVDALGLAIRTFQRTHLASGNFALGWDGRNDSGLVVADGEYRVRVENQSGGVTVDTVAPVASLAIGSFAANFRPVPTSSGLQVWIPTVMLSRSWQATDLHFSEWTLEESDGQGGSQFSVAQTGRDERANAESLVLSAARGRRYRLRASDAAGNSALTPATPVPEEFFVTAVDEADRLAQSGVGLVVDGSLEPRIDLMQRHYERELIEAPHEGLLSTRYAFAFESTARAPLVAFSVAYHSLPAGPVVIDTANVALLSPHVVIWDARLVPPGSYQVEVRATDSAGNQFSDSVTFEDNQRAQYACVSVAGSNLLRYEMEAPGTPENFVAGALVTLVPVGGSAGVATATLSAVSVATGKQAANIPLSPTLTECRYQVLVEGPTEGGATGTSRSQPIDICGIHVIALSVSGTGVLEGDLVETFAKPIVSVDVLVRGRPVATLPSFAGSVHFSAQLPSTLCGATAILPQFKVRFGDGTELTTNYRNPPLSLIAVDGEFTACLVRQGEYSCVRPQLAVTASAPPAPRCVAQVPTFQIAAAADAVPGQTVSALSIGYRSANGNQTFALAAASPAPAAHAELIAGLDSAVLAEGAYIPVADLLQSDGIGVTALGPQFVVDRVPPVVGFISPTPAERVCPVSRRTPSGRLMNVLDLTGFVVEANPVGRPEISLTSSSSSSAQSVPLVNASLTQPVGEIDAPPSGDYEAIIEARDVSGSSSCNSVSFHFVAPVVISGVRASPALFSPDNDTLFDTSLVSFSLSEGAEVVVRARPPTGAPRVVAEISTGTGQTTFTWDGRDSTGLPLADGVWTLEISALDECGASAEASVPVRLDRQAPVARLDTPLASATVRAVLIVAGEASDENFERSELRIDDGSGAASVLRVSGLPSSGTLGSFPTTGLVPGAYTLSLDVTDLVGHTTTATRLVNVTGSRLITDVVSAPLVISPNGDGRVDAATLTFSIQAQADVAVELLEAGSVVRQVAALSAVVGPQSVSLDSASLGQVVDGTYSVRIVAQDVGGIESEEVPLIVDLTAPLLAVTSPTQQQAIAGSGSVTGSVDDPHLASWTLGVTSAGSSTAVSSGGAAMTGVLGQLAGLADGPAALELRATDVAGNDALLVVAFSSDSTPPLVSFRQPQAGAFLSGADGGVDVQFDATDDSLALVTLSAGTRALHSGSTVPTGVTWDVAVESDGPLELVLVATDLAGNQSEARIGVVVDNTPPVAIVTSPRNSVLALPGQFLGTASDTNFDSYLLEVAPGSTSSAYQFITLASGSTAVTSGVLGTLATAPPDGLYTSRLTVEDRAGNRTVTLTEFTSDNTPPAAPVLSLTRGGPSEARLSWLASSSSDIVGYIVTRESPVSAVELASSTLALIDPGLTDGNYRYRVIAVDAAGLRSLPSNEQSFEADSTPPVVALYTPPDGSSWHGATSVIGTATAPDLNEYRLSLGEGSVPTSFNLLTASPTSVQSGALGAIDTATLAQGATYTLLLEASDLHGNVASVRSHFVVDDLAPAAPVLLSVTSVLTTVFTNWQPSAEPDVVGYLLFRDFQLVNGPAGSVADPLPYLLPASTSNYINFGLPDGTFSYQLQAVDAAGNLSPLSNAISVTVNVRTPVAAVVSPSALARLAGPTVVVVDSTDQDLATINVELRSGNGAWTSLGLLSAPPWTVSFDPAAFPSPIFEVRATATDTFGATDPAPASTFFFFSTPPSTPLVSTLVNGSSVSLAWTDPNPPGTVAGFLPRRDGSAVVAPPRPVGTATATSNSSLAGRGYDSSFFTNWTSSSSFPQTWQLDLATPVVIDGFRCSFSTVPTFEVQVRVKGVWVSGPQLRDTPDALVDLAPGLEVSGIRVVIKSDQYGFAGLGEVQVVPAPLVAQSPFVDVTSTAPHSYTVDAITPFGDRARGSANALVYQPTLSAASLATAAPSIDLSGAGAQPGDGVELRSGTTLLGQPVADATGHFAFSAALALGPNTFTAVATNTNGDRSLPSAPLTVVRATEPTAAIVLALGAVTGSSVGLTFVVSGDTSDVTGFVVSRSDGSQSSVAGIAGPSDRAFTDQALLNGTYVYMVSAQNAAGLIGPPSNAITAVVDVTVAPPVLVVTAVPVGRSLHLEWTWAGTPSGGFRVERSTVSASGPFTLVPGAEALFTVSLDDTGLTEGASYWYRAFARDSGNLSASSNVASGVAHDATAPAAPRLTAPTKPGAPIVVTSPITTVKGFTESGAAVTLLRNGVSMGTRFAGPESFVHTAISTNVPWWNVVAVSPDQRQIAYGYATSQLGIAIEDLITHAVITVDTPGHSPMQLTFAPDSSKLVVELSSQNDGRRHLTVISTVTGAEVPLLPTSSANESMPVWSPDSTRIAYQSSNPPALSMIGVSVPGTGTETLLSAPGVDFQAATVIVGPRVVGRGYSTASGQYVLVSFDLALGSQTTIFAGYFGEAVATPGQSRIAIGSNYSPDVITLLDLLSGQQETIGVGRALALSPDGERLVWATENQLFVSRLSDLQRTSIDTTFDLYSDHASWFGNEALLQARASGTLEKIEWGAPFEFTGLQLVPGANEFVAIAQDEGGNDSPASAAIRVTFDASTTADLSPTLALLPIIPIATQPANVMVTVRNLGGGSAGPADVLAVVIGADGSLRSAPAVRTPTIASGQSVVVSVPIDVAGLSGPGNSVRVVIDPSGQVAESNRANNSASVDFSVASGANLGLTVRAQPGTVGANGLVTADVDLLNPAQARSLTVRLFIASPDGSEALAIPPAADFPSFGTGATASFSRTVNVGALLAGDYEVVAEASSGGQVIARASTPLVVTPSPSATVTVRTSRAQYLEGEFVNLAATVTNTSVNTLLTSASMRFELVNAGGVVVFTQTAGLPVLSLTDSTSVAATGPTALPAGNYAARALVTEGSVTLATGLAPFSVASRPLLKGALDIQGSSTSPAVVAAGSQVLLDVQVNNGGSATAAAVNATVVVTGPSNVVVSSQVIAIGALAGNASSASTIPVSTVGFATGLYAVSLVLEATAIPLFEAATLGLRVTDGAPPTLEVLGLTQGALVSAHPVARVQARDDSGVGAVRVSVDGVISALVAVNGFAQDGEWALQLAVSDGPHTLVFSAVDVDGNDGLTTPSSTNPVTVSFVTDSTPPVIAITGVTEGALSAIALVPVVTVQDANPGSVQISLNGSAFTSGTSITTDGSWILEVVATDTAGNQSTRRVSFELDATPPLIVPRGFAEGSFGRVPVTPDYSIIDVHAVTATATLDGVSFTPGQVISSEGPHLLHVVATDSAGNVATLEGAFTIDSTQPQLTIGGFVDGEVTSRTVLPTASVVDVNLLSLEVRLDGALFVAGSSVNSEADHLFAATAVDKAGNASSASGTFTIDTLAPQLIISGVVDGQTSRGALVPVVTVNELHPATQTVLLNGVPFASGALVSSEGQYTLSVSATDAAGNAATRSLQFVIDSTPPLIVITGVADGQVSPTALSPVIAVTDDNLASSTVTLDGLPFVAGTLVGSEGPHALNVTAIDLAGNTAAATVNFIIDSTGPVIVIAGVSDGQVSAVSVVPVVSVIDATLTSVTVLLNGAPFTSGSTVSIEGAYVLAVMALDAAGNTANRTLSFSVDRTPPTVTFTGFTNGSVQRGPVTPGFTVSELHPASATATLNGQPFTPGTVVSSEGVFTLSVVARDQAGSTTNASASFTIDLTSPVITVTGVSQGQVSAVALMPVIVTADLHLSNTTVLLNGAPFISGTPVSAAGEYALDVSAVDAAGNTATRQVTFAVDRTAPLIAILGVADGAISTTPVTPVIVVTEPHPGTDSATLNGAPFTSGATVSAAGTYTLVATATDAAGNAATVTIQFTLQTAQPSVRVVKGPLGTFTRTLALVESRNCRLRTAEVARTENFLNTTLGGTGQVVSITWSKASFLTELRGGQYNVYLVLNVGMSGCEGDDDDDDHHDGDGCGDDGEHHDGHERGNASFANWTSNYASSSGPSGNLSNAIADELTEQVFGGHAGLVLVDALNSSFDLRDATGLSIGGNVRPLAVQFAPGPLAPPGPLAVMGRARELHLGAASLVASYTPASQHADAAATSLFGLGKTVTFGFDLTRATPMLQSQLTLSRAVGLVTPPPGAANALAVSGVRLSVENPGAAVTASVRETLTSPLYALDSLPDATVSSMRRQLDWQVPLSTGQSVPFTYWARLPDALGAWNVSTDVRVGGVVVAQQQSALSVTQSGANLLTNAQVTTRLLTSNGSVGSRRATILSRLSQVQARSISQRRDVDDNLEDLLFAAARAAEVQGTLAAQVRQQLAHLILYWEARWYVY